MTLKIKNNAIEFIDKEDVVPAVVIMAAICKRHVTSSFLLLIPVLRQNERAEIDTKRYAKNYIKQNIFRVKNRESEAFVFMKDSILYSICCCEFRDGLTDKIFHNNPKNSLVA